jgi:hypothetical protein
LLTSDLLLASADVLVQLLSVLSDGELAVVVHADSNGTRTARLIISVVELTDIGVTQSLLDCQSSVRVEVQEVQHQVQSLF